MFRFINSPAAAHSLIPRSTSPAEAFLAGWCPRVRTFTWPGGGSLRFRRPAAAEADVAAGVSADASESIAQITAFGQIWCIDQLAERVFTGLGLDIRRLLSQYSQGPSPTLDAADQARLAHLTQTARHLLSPLRNTVFGLDQIIAQPSAHMLPLIVEYCPDTFEVALPAELVRHTIWGTLDAWQSLAALFEALQQSADQAPVFGRSVDVGALPYEAEVVIGHLNLDRAQCDQLSTGSAILIDDYRIDAEGQIRVPLFCPQKAATAMGVPAGWQVSVVPQTAVPGSPGSWRIVNASPHAADDADAQWMTTSVRHSSNRQALERVGHYQFRLSAGHFTVRLQHLLTPPTDWRPGGECHVPQLHILDQKGHLLATGRLILIDTHPAVQFTSSLCWPGTPTSTDAEAAFAI